LARLIISAAGTASWTQTATPVVTAVVPPRAARVVLVGKEIVAPRRTVGPIEEMVLTAVVVQRIVRPGSSRDRSPPVTTVRQHPLEAFRDVYRTLRRWAVDGDIEIKGAAPHAANDEPVETATPTADLLEERVKLRLDVTKRRFRRDSAARGPRPSHVVRVRSASIHHTTSTGVRIALVVGI
jgi:hypothetical protein